jgi:signal transduction histidine kinase
MGLAIVRAILVAHGGSIEATSEPGAGACFRFWVPLATEEAGSAAEDTSAIAKTGQLPDA